MKKYSQALSLLFILASIFSTKASAEVWATDEGYDEFRQSEEFQYYMHGLVEGITWSNNLTNEFHGVRLFCAPLDELEDTDAYIKLMDNGVKTMGDNDARFLKLFPVSAILMLELRKTYPCDELQNDSSAE